MKGTIKFFNRQKGYGFIEPEQDEKRDDLFFHVTNFNFNPAEVNIGDEVKFEVGSNEKGDIAIEIQKAK